MGWRAGNSEAIISRYDALAQISGDQWHRTVDTDIAMEVTVWLNGVSPMAWRRVQEPGSIMQRESACLTAVDLRALSPLK